jgi:hypothetical protein
VNVFKVFPLSFDGGRGVGKGRERASTQQGWQEGMADLFALLRDLGDHIANKGEGSSSTQLDDDDPVESRFRSVLPNLLEGYLVPHKGTSDFLILFFLGGFCFSSFGGAPIFNRIGRFLNFLLAGIFSTRLETGLFLQNSISFQLRVLGFMKWGGGDLCTHFIHKM